MSVLVARCVFHCEAGEFALQFLHCLQKALKHTFVNKCHTWCICTDKSRNAHMSSRSSHCLVPQLCTGWKSLGVEDEGLEGRSGAHRWPWRVLWTPRGYEDNWDLRTKRKLAIRKTTSSKFCFFSLARADAGRQWFLKQCQGKGKEQSLSEGISIHPKPWGNSHCIFWFLKVIPKRFLNKVNGIHSNKETNKKSYREGNLVKVKSPEKVYMTTFPQAHTKHHPGTEHCRDLATLSCLMRISENKIYLE